MDTAAGFSLRVFVPDGQPEGLRLIEKSNWTGQGLVYPRPLHAKAQSREELSRTGVYVLWGLGESGQLPRAYVGEGDELRPRFDSHHKSKDFWTHAVAFTSKDQNLNKAHVQYLEAKLVNLASEAKRCDLDNANVPQAPSLSEADAADAELFLSDMLLCLPVAGVDFFKRPPARAETSRDLFLKAKGISAQGFEDTAGFVVLAGSQAVKEEVPSISESISRLRSDLDKQGVLKEDGTVYRLTRNYTFNSPSAASDALLGHSSNGRTAWKDANGLTLKEIQETATEPPTPS